MKMKVDEPVTMFSEADCICDSTSSGEGESFRDELNMTEVSDWHSYLLQSHITANDSTPFFSFILRTQEYEFVQIKLYR
jgi:hypothetical protein